jgi:hypothetical protein
MSFNFSLETYCEVRYPTENIAGLEISQNRLTTRHSWIILSRPPTGWYKRKTWIYTTFSPSL